MGINQEQVRWTGRDEPVDASFGHMTGEYGHATEFKLRGSKVDWPGFEPGASPMPRE